MSARSPSSWSATTKPLLRYVARRFRPDLAEDAVQEALLSAHRALMDGTWPDDSGRGCRRSRGGARWT